MRGKTKTYNPKVKVFYRPEEFSFEMYDCTVRALATATGISYKNSHKMMARFGYRENRKGTFFTTFVKICRRWGMFTKDDARRPTITITKQFNGLTLNKLFKDEKFLKGKWIVKVLGHVFCADRGIIQTEIPVISEGESAKKKVLMVFEVKEKTK